MDNLKNFIDANRDAFEDELLPEGHLARFEEKLPLKQKQPTKWIALFAGAAAAVVAFFVYINIQSGIGEAPVHQTGTFACETQEEIEELRVYYNMQMEELYAQIRGLYKSDQASGGLELLQETKQVLKSSQDFEENVLPNLPCSEAGLFAMSQHYNTSLQSLNIMLKQMESVIEANEDF